MMYVRFPLLLRQVEDLPFDRGIDISHETVRFWWNRLGRCLPRRSGNAALIIIRIRTAVGAWTKRSSILMARRTTSGGPPITRAKYWRFCHETAGYQGGTDLYQAGDETLRPAKGDSDGPASIVPGCDECDWQG
jgi:hypothetical protein